MGEAGVEALRLLHVPFAEIAEAVGVGYDTVKGWSSGRADPSPENRVALSKFMRAHAKKLEAAAEQLRREAGGDVP